MTKILNILALILGIVAISPITALIGFLLYWLLPLAAIVIGIVSLKKNQGESKALSKLGIGFGIAGFVMIFVWFIVLVSLGAGGLLHGL
jgi:hypothetical protein